MQNKLVYILDDNDSSKRKTRNTIEEGLFKVEVKCYSSSDNLIKDIHRVPPDVVVVSHDLAGKLTSPSVIRAIRKIDDKVLIIDVLRHDDPEAAMVSIKAGANNVTFQKDTDRIVRMIKNHLRIRNKFIKGDLMSDIMAVYKQQRINRLKEENDGIPLSKLLHNWFVDTGINTHIKPKETESSLGTA